MATLAPYNVSLTPFSPLWIYGPARDTDAAQGWNASYIGVASPADGAPADGTAYRRTQTSGARISFSFEGTGLYLCFNTGGAGFALTLDGEIVQTTAAAAGQRVCDYADGEADTLLYASGLEYGSHSALLQVAASADHEFRFFGGALEIGVQTGGKVVDDSRTIDDQDTGWILEPGRGGGLWDTVTVQRLFNLTTTFECNYGQDISAAYKFSGAGGAVLFGGISPESHDYSVQLNDERPVNLDATSGWSDGSAVFYFVGDLDPAKEHTITIRNFNSDAPECNLGRLCCLSLDAIRLLRAGTEDLPIPSQDPDNDNDGGGGNGGNNGNNGGGNDNNGGDGQQGPNPASSSSSNTAAIAGGVVGAVALVAVVGLIVFFLFRRRRRQAEDDAYSSQQPMSDEHLARPWVSPQPQPHSQVGSSDVSSPTPLGADAHWSPYTSMGTGSGGIAVPGAVVATGDKKQRSGYGAVANQIPGQPPPNANANPAPSDAGGSADGAAQPRLAQQDLEQVLAFVAQRMDGAGRVASVHEDETLPQYRR